MNTLHLVLMASPGGAQGGGQQFIFLILLIVVFYMFFIRPQMKKTKEQKKFREALDKGQKIVTIGGIHGKIIEISDTTVVIETEDQSRLRMEKTAITADGQATADQMAQKK